MARRAHSLPRLSLEIYNRDLQTRSTCGRSVQSLSVASPWIETMNRCSASLLLRPFGRRASLGLVFALLASLALPALTQGSLRNFPKAALRGNMTMTAPPQVLLDGKPEKLAPGVRIRNTKNLIVMPGTLRGEWYVVNYVRDLNGLIHEVWILSAREAEEKRATASTGRNFMFGSETKQDPASLNRP